MFSPGSAASGAVSGKTATKEHDAQDRDLRTPGRLCCHLGAPRHRTDSLRLVRNRAQRLILDTQRDKPHDCDFERHEAKLAELDCPGYESAERQGSRADRRTTAVASLAGRVPSRHGRAHGPAERLSHRPHALRQLPTTAGRENPSSLEQRPGVEHAGVEHQQPPVPDRCREVPQRAGRGFPPGGSRPPVKGRRD